MATVPRSKSALAPGIALSVAVPVSSSLPAIEWAVPNKVISVMGEVAPRALRACVKSCAGCGLAC
jgi:hypothetical protein